MRQLILVGACYLDTIISVPYYPDEDTKLRATDIQVRRGGNCPNALEVLQQLVAGGGGGGGDGESGRSRDVTACLVSCLPAADAPATRTILDSFGPPPARPFLCFDHCLYRDGHIAPASCYILRSAASGSRTSVNANRLPDMTVDEFAAVVAACAGTAATWWHFEGRIPDVTLACIRHLRRALAAASVVVSVEVEKPDRQGLRALAAEADVVFYSRLWAQGQGYADAEACLRGEATSLPRAKLLFCTWGAQGASALACLGSHVSISPVPLPLPASSVVDSVGAGDTFVAGILYKLACEQKEAEAGAAAETESDRLRPATAWNLDDANVQEALAFAVDLATRKVQIDGFRGLVVAQTSSKSS